MESVVVKEVIVLTIALLTSLSQWFSEGTVAFQKEAYEPAVVAFSKVIDTEVAENPLYEPALYWRAQCYRKLSRKEAAVADLDALLKQSPGGPFGPLATADYKALTGKAWGGVDLSSPEKTWHSFVRAIDKRDADGVIRCCGGKFKQQFTKMVLEQEDFWEEMSDEIPRLTYLSTRLNEKKNVAIINLAKQGRERGEQLRAELVAGQWLLTDEGRSAARDGFGEETQSARSKQHADINKLRQWDAAMEQFMMASGRRPTSLAEPSDYVKNPEEAKRSSVDGKPFVFAVPRDATAQPWVFTATTTGGQRVALVNGSVRVIDDAEFAALSKQYGVKVPGAWKKVVVSPDTQKEVAALIVQLGASTFKIRQEAYEKLKALGPAAGKLLEEATHHADMEIALQAKRLLEEI